MFAGGTKKGMKGFVSISRNAWRIYAWLAKASADRNVRLDADGIYDY